MTMNKNFKQNVVNLSDIMTRPFLVGKIVKFDFPPTWRPVCEHIGTFYV